MKQDALTEGVYYILLSLQQPLHGYGIMQNVSDLSNGRVTLAAGTLYGALNTLIKKEWIVQISDEGPKGKKEYMITAEGKDVLKKELIRLTELVENGNKIIGG